ncbi:ATP-binding cassette domain-containing protein [Alkalispirochaeta americana]|nr:ATP-binding cassette domain-containing protein [Alkalispirochaeta americana]
MDMTMERVDTEHTTIELQKAGFSHSGETLLQETSLSISEGSCVLVMGPSGAGKSLLLKILAGIIPLTTGRITLGGTDLGQASNREMKSLRTRQGFVFQDAALWQNLSIRQNLSLPLQYNGPHRSPRQIEERIASLANRIGFYQSLDLRPARLSSGSQMMVGIMRALMTDPEICFLDEPSNGLDTATQQNLLDILQDLKQRGKTLVIASHDSTIASRLADQFLLIDQGEVIFFDTAHNSTRAENSRVREILQGVLGLSATYDADILDILGGGDENPFG